MRIVDLLGTYLYVTVRLDSDNGTVVFKSKIYLRRLILDSKKRFRLVGIVGDYLSICRCSRGISLCKPYRTKRVPNPSPAFCDGVHDST